MWLDIVGTNLKSGDFYFQEDGVDVHCPISPAKTTENLEHYISNKHKKTLKGGEKAYRLGTQAPKEWHGGEFPGFSFCLIYPKLGAEDAGNLETGMGAD